MLSLYKTASEIRLVLKWLAILAGTVLVLFVLIKVGGVLKEAISPTPPPPPTVLYGKLPPIPFKASLNGSKYSYVLNTVSGELPSFPDRAKVYKFSFAQANLLALDRAQEKVRSIGFSSNPIPLSNTEYQWNENTSPFRKITAEVLNFNFDLISSYAQDPEIQEGQNLPNEAEAKKAVANFMVSLKSAPTDIDEEKTKTTLYRMNGSDLAEATSLSNTQIIKVDLFQKDIDEKKIYYPNPQSSTMNFLVGGGRFGGQIVEAHYFHNTITENYATYPIISSDTAWELLKGGKAHIATHNGASQTITIKKIELAYYSPDEKYDYLMPIIIFEGEDNFFAYVSATTEDWINKK